MVKIFWNHLMRLRRVDIKITEAAIATNLSNIFPEYIQVNGIQ